MREQIHSNYLVQHVTLQAPASQNALRSLGATFLTKAGGAADDGSARAAATVAAIVRREANVLGYADAFTLTFWASIVGLLLIATVTRAPSGPLAK
jgi:DHA2 family multidrug resistance protein